MGRYNEKDNDDYLLKHNLFGVDSHEELEKAETFRIKAENNTNKTNLKRNTAE